MAERSGSRACDAARRRHRTRGAGVGVMGASTYIGNAPNFMVYAIATERGVKMPSFFGFMGWSALVLLPVFALLTGVMTVTRW